jgi:hypothetical protein
MLLLLPRAAAGHDRRRRVVARADDTPEHPGVRVAVLSERYHDCNGCVTSASGVARGVYNVGKGL